MRYWDKHWRTVTGLALLLLPIAGLYCFLAWLHRTLYRIGLRRRIALPVPVVVVGNISVGGTGKTPLVLWLAAKLRDAGWRPGIITRGYRGRASVWPVTVDGNSDANLVGDEAVLLARRSGCPVAAGPDRIAAARLLLGRCDVIISDDGLQHHRMARDVEIVVIDGERRLGNRLCLPAGPLRETPTRLHSVDVIVAQGQPREGELGFVLRPVGFRSVRPGGGERALGTFALQAVHAVAGIGNPERFFATLRSLGAEVTPHALGDHHAFTADDIRFTPTLPVIMTEKDAVKCAHLAGADHWYLAVEPEVDPQLATTVIHLLEQRRHG